MVLRLVERSLLPEESMLGRPYSLAKCMIQQQMCGSLFQVLSVLISDPKI